MAESAAVEKEASSQARPLAGALLGMVRAVRYVCV